MAFVAGASWSCTRRHLCDTERLTNKPTSSRTSRRSAPSCAHHDGNTEPLQKRVALKAASRQCVRASAQSRWSKRTTARKATVEVEHCPSNVAADDGDDDDDDNDDDTAADAYPQKAEVNCSLSSFSAVDDNDNAAENAHEELSSELRASAHGPSSARPAFSEHKSSALSDERQDVDDECRSSVVHVREGDEYSLILRSPRRARAEHSDDESGDVEDEAVIEVGVDGAANDNDSDDDDGDKEKKKEERLRAASEAERVEMGRREEQLNQAQRLALGLSAEGKNLFITGRGGSGKSYLIGVLTHQLRAKYGAGRVGLTASTGVAAELIGGHVLHSFLGISSALTVDSFKNLRKPVIRQLVALVIDEVSMVSGEMLDRIDEAFRTVRGRPQSPFGGVQMIFCGDFYQLPPVPNLTRSMLVQQLRLYPKNVQRLFLNRGLAFESNAWMGADVHVVVLQDVQRQSDLSFIAALEDLRLGRDTRRTARLMQQVARPLREKDDNGVEVTHLYARKRDVDEHNRKRLDAIDEQVVMYKSRDGWQLDPRLVRRQEASRRPDETGQPNLAAQKKAEQDVEKAKKYLLSMFRDIQAAESVELKRGAQVMLRRNLSSRGQTYLVNGSQGVIEGFSSSMYPKIRFENGLRVLVGPARWQVKLPGVGTVQRLQVPLTLSWAITIHRSQGLTMDRICVDLSNIFESSMVYVALSRARAVDGLQVISSQTLPLRRKAPVEGFYADLSNGRWANTKSWEVDADADIEHARSKIREERKKQRKLEREQLAKAERKAKGRGKAEGRRDARTEKPRGGGGKSIKGKRKGDAEGASSSQ